MQLHLNEIATKVMRNVMVCGVISVGPDIPVRIAANAMVRNCVSALPVIDIYAKLVGIVSEGDLIRRVEIGTERRRSAGAGETLMSSDSLAKEFVKSHAKRVSDVMTREVITAQPETPLREIANLMEKHSIKRVPIGRVMVRRDGEQEVKTALACETLVEDGMQVAFLDYFSEPERHVYRIEDIGDSWHALRTISETFPEAAHCRHCSGCDRACPKGLDVQRGVNLAVAGDLAEASRVFDECVMCNLCTLACPEHIRPNHLGLFVRRMIAAYSLRPANLMWRLQQIESGEMQIDFDAPGAQPPR